MVSASSIYASNARMFTVTEKQSDSEINVKRGDIIQVELLAWGSAGYNWYTDQIDTGHLKLISEKTSKISGSRKVGTPALVIWKFKAIKQGSAEIKMDLYRKWEGIEKSVDHFFLKINISN